MAYDACYSAPRDSDSTICYIWVRPHNTITMRRFFLFIFCFFFISPIVWGDLQGTYSTSDGFYILRQYDTGSVLSDTNNTWTNTYPEMTRT